MHTHTHSTLTHTYTVTHTQHTQQGFIKLSTVPSLQPLPQGSKGLATKTSLEDCGWTNQSESVQPLLQYSKQSEHSCKPLYASIYNGVAIYNDSVCTHTT